MPVVIIEMWEGRTREQKKEICEGISQIFIKQGVPPEMIHIIMHDNSKKNWGNAGKLCAE